MNGQSRGFSLIEMLAVMAALALAAALAAPALGSNLAKLALRAEARQIAGLFKAAEIEALKARAPVSLRFSLAPPATTLGAGAPVALSGKASLKITSAAGEGAPVFTFFPDGTNTGGRVVLARGGHAITIDSNWLTGHVRTTANAAGPQG